MKRHLALQELSRDHLRALVLAYALRHGRFSNPRYHWPESPETQRDLVLAVYQAELKGHFALEEEYLLDILPEAPETKQIIKQHQNIYLLMDELQAAKVSDLPQVLLTLGHDLEQHVRFEERHWFERLQAEDAVSELEHWAEAMASFHAEHVHEYCLTDSL